MQTVTDYHKMISEPQEAPEAQGTGAEPQAPGASTQCHVDALERARARRALELDTQFSNRVTAVKLGHMGILDLWAWMGKLSTLETEMIFRRQFALK